MSLCILTCSPVSEHNAEKHSPSRDENLSSSQSAKNVVGTGPDSILTLDLFPGTLHTPAGIPFYMPTWSPFEKAVFLLVENLLLITKMEQFMFLLHLKSRLI